MGRGSSGASAKRADDGEPVVSIKSSGGRERVLVSEKDGHYIFNGSVPSPGPVDTNSTEYKRALRDYNVKASFHEDGSVTVQKGGMYSRKREFKSLKEFKNDANKKLDQSIAFNDAAAKSAKSGRMSQLEMENAKTIARNNVTPQAMAKIAKSLSEKVKAANVRAEAARDMKRRLNIHISRRK